MSDTTDHAAAIRQAVIALRKHYIETGRLHSGRLDDEIDALAAERDALLAYAKDIEWQWAPHIPVGSGDIADLRKKHNVAAIMAREGG